MVAAMAEAQGRGAGSLGRVMALGHRLLGTHKMLLGREKQDVLVADDRAPMLAETRAIWAGGLGRAWRIAPGARALDEARARGLIRRLARKTGPLRVVFACQGNICRSPYAEAVLRQRLGAQERVRVASAGMMPRRDRPVPDLFRTQAGTEGIDLRDHRSQWLPRDLAEAADVIVVFDRVNLAAVADRYPHRRAATILLGDLIGIGEIEDPVDGDAAFAAATYAKIRRAVEALAALLTDTTGSRRSRT
jgi:protein-tyrosine-phosphatase